ncbi:MAG TPA: hypothetical protein VJ783_30350, partial [Pirellulales bacterium]|nr:hypothetical protein [Pirellulales bacterium]
PETKSQPLEFRHDAGRFGIPRQEWTAGKKIVWLLHVVSQQAQVSEISGPVIAATFNKHFRQAGSLNKQGMSRDLGGLKQRGPALVGDNANSSPITWFLTNEGQKEAERLVIEARGEAAQS